VRQARGAVAVSNSTGAPPGLPSGKRLTRLHRLLERPRLGDAGGCDKGVVDHRGAPLRKALPRASGIVHKTELATQDPLRGAKGDMGRSRSAISRFWRSSRLRGPRRPSAPLVERKREDVFAHGRRIRGGRRADVDYHTLGPVPTVQPSFARKMQPPCRSSGTSHAEGLRAGLEAERRRRCKYTAAGPSTNITPSPLCPPPQGRLDDPRELEDRLASRL
jgi:hypothetical protein